jgi:hypothetical protein
MRSSHVGSRLAIKYQTTVEKTYYGKAI